MCRASACVLLLLGTSSAFRPTGLVGLRNAPLLRSESHLTVHHQSQLKSSGRVHMGLVGPREMVSRARTAWDCTFGESCVVQNVPCGDMNEEECMALCTDEESCTVMYSKSLAKNIQLMIYFALWYVLSIGYNISNKKRLMAWPLPWTQSALSLLVGSIWVLPIWALKLRKLPKIPASAWKTLVPIAAFHAVGHIGAVVAMGAGTVSFTHIVKAAEPVFTCAMSAIFLKRVVAWPVALSLLPIIFGVSLASVKELSFTWLAFNGAMLSNLAFAGRAIFSKQSMDKPKGENMTPANLFAVLTILSFLLAVPFALVLEGPRIMSSWAEATTFMPASQIIRYIVETGIYFYTYNEVAFMALNSIHPVTHAVANTLKRVVIIVASVVVFNTPVTFLGCLGSSIAIAGSGLYSVVKKMYPERDMSVSQTPPVNPGFNATMPKAA